MRRGLSTAMALALFLIPAPSASAQTSQPSYPDTTAGLKQLFKDLLTASKAKDQRAVVSLAQSMVLPNAEQWFTRTFGETIAPRMFKEYQETASRVDLELSVKFLALKEPEKLEITVQRVEASDDLNSRIFQRLALAAMREPTALYSVTVSLPGTTAKIEIWNIVYVDGAFRAAGKMQAIRG